MAIDEQFIRDLFGIPASEKFFVASDNTSTTVPAPIVHCQITPEFRRRFLALEESFYNCSESLGEFETQYLSEKALYGDAGPGQYLDIMRLRYKLAKIKMRYDKIQTTSQGLAIKAERKKEYDEYLADSDSNLHRSLAY